MEVLNLTQLRCFVEASETGTMTAAAERLQVTQSAVSLSIAGLENRVGTQLLIRSRSTGLRLTAAGRDLLPRARALVAHAEEVRDAMETAGAALRGRLVVGCFQTIAPFVLPAVLDGMAREHPEIVLEFVEAPGPQLSQALADGTCEIAIFDALEVGPGLTQEPLFSLRPHVVVDPGHPLADRPELTLAELAGHDLVLLDVPPSGEYFRGLFRAAGLEPRVRHRASSIELVRSLVARGQGYGLLASRPATDVSWEGRPLRDVELAGDIDPVRFSLAWVAGTRPTARARAFADVCRRLTRRGRLPPAHGRR